VGEPAWGEVAALVAHWQPTVLMVGIPLGLNGNEQGITRAARRFAQQLQERSCLPVYKVDERFTTLEAKRYLFEKGGVRALSKKNIDGWSAKIITEHGLRQLGRLGLQTWDLPQSKLQCTGDPL